MQKSGSVYRQQFLELIRVSLKRQDISFCNPAILILHECNYISGCDDDYTPVILRQPKFNPPIQTDGCIAQRTRSAKSSLSLSRANQTKHSDKAIKLDINHPNLSCSSEPPTKISTLSPDKLPKTNTDDSSFSHANQPASKKFVQSTLDFGKKAIDVKISSVGHTPTKRSSPSSDIVHTRKNCDNTCNTHPGIMSKQSPDHSLTPHPTCTYKQNAKKQSNEFKHDVGNTQSHNSDDNKQHNTQSHNSDDNKQHNMLSQSNSGNQKSADHNSELQTAKPLQINTDTCTSESDSDFVNTKAKVKKCNPMKSHKQKQISPKCWEDLDSSLQTLLPNIDKVTYVVESHEDREQPSFEGAPKFNFDLIVRINLETQDQANDFLNKMMSHSYCTYRISRTSKKPALKRVAYKIEMHCQHFKKALTNKQKEKAILAKSKKARKPFTMQIRNKKTQCPSHLTLTGQILTKKQLLAINVKPYLKTHTAVLKITFNHNHPIVSGHALSFRPISAETKQTFFELFSNGHSASSARHAHEQHLLMDAATDELKQYALADRALNPCAQDVCRLFQQWREKHYGKDDGKPLFEQLQAEVNKFNVKY